MAYSPALESISGTMALPLAAVDLGGDHVRQFGIGQAAEERERVLPQLARHVAGQVREPATVIGEDVEDAVVTVREAKREPGNRLRFLVDVCLGALEELLDVRFVTALRLECEQQPLRDV